MNAQREKIIKSDKVAEASAIYSVRPQFGVRQANSSPAARSRHAMDRIQAALKSLFDAASPEDLEQLASKAEAVAAPPVVPSHEVSLAQALSEGRAYTQSQKLVLEMDNQARHFQDRRNLLADALTSTQVASLLGTSRQTPHDRVNGGSLLAVSEQGRLMFPPWQFDPEGPHGVLPGLSQVLRSLEVSPVAKVRWLTRPNPTLDRQTPVDLLKRGELGRVLDAAASVGVG